MRVVMVGDIAHVVVDINRTEVLVRYRTEAPVHVRQGLSWRLDAVLPPDHHRYLTDLTFGDPAYLVLVVPGREVSGLAELAGAGLSLSHVRIV
jgi:hypothetical protein